MPRAVLPGLRRRMRFPALLIACALTPSGICAGSAAKVHSAVTNPAVEARGIHADLSEPGAAEQVLRHLSRLPARLQPSVHVFSAGTTYQDVDRPELVRRMLNIKLLSAPRLAAETPR